MMPRGSVKRARRRLSPEAGLHMFSSGDGLFGSGNAVVEPRIYELTGHLGALGVVSIVLGAILWAAIMAVLVLLIIDLVRRQRHSRAAGALPPAPVVPVQQGREVHASSSGADALRMLNERYALGEIDHDDYVQRRGDLTGA
jgi:uncharacterized membrane protein